MTAQNAVKRVTSSIMQANIAISAMQAGAGPGMLLGALFLNT